MATWATVPAKERNPLQKVGRYRYVTGAARAQAVPTMVKNRAQYQGALDAVLFMLMGYMVVKMPRSCMMLFWMRKKKSGSAVVPAAGGEWYQAKKRGIKLVKVTRVVIAIMAGAM
jgi:hypothetical protein